MLLRRTKRMLFFGLVLTLLRTTTSYLIDRRGLQFIDQEAFCAYHCSTSHVALAYRHLVQTSECFESNCGSFLLEPSRHRTQRRLRPAFSFENQNHTNQTAVTGDVHGASEDGKDVTIISVVSCSSVTDVTLSIGDPETDAFANFYHSFSTAYDAMLSGENAAYDACQLQFLQKELLAKYSAELDDEEDQMEIKPTLIKLHTKSQELQCLKQIKTIWPATSESHTPFLTRSDQSGTTATVMLVHVSATVGDNILALDCVDSVTVLPAILKLMPFAKSSYAFSRVSSEKKEGPPLEIRLAKVVNTAQAFKRLSTYVTRATGIQNLITMKKSTAEIGGVLQQAAVDDYDTWTQALAIILDDEAVEWVDLQQVVTTSALKTLALEQRLLRQQYMDVSESIETVEHTSRRLDEYLQDLVGVDIMQAHNITGSSIIVGITDTGLYIDHDQFDQDSRKMYDNEDMTARKVVSYQTFANSVDESEDVTCGHGTHVSGIVAGSSYTGQNRDLGIASSARIAFMDIGKQESKCAGKSGCDVSLETPGEVKNLMAAQVAAGAKVFSFSWGTGANDYNAQTQQVDEYIYDNPEILIVVAAGNSGEKGDHTISSPSGAKNVISVGASLNAAASFSATSCPSVLNERTVASFSSIGPTLDGRQKPDLVAPGMSVISSQSEKPGSKVKSSAVCSLQGTSQATPVVAGMAVLIYEWLRDGWWKNGVADPTYGMDTIPASLIKALLLHSGEAMSRRLIEPSTGVTSCVALEATAKTLTSYPDYSQGYGKPTMLNLVTFMDDSQASSSSSSGGSNTIYFFPNSSTGSEPSVTEGSEVTFHFMLTVNVNLRVTIVWTDPPGSVGSKTTLQNDLDLTLKIANTSKIIYPLSGNGSRDSVNNVEMVEVSYDDALVAVMEAGVTVKEGFIYIQAVVRGHSVKAGENATTSGQKFSIVASSTPSSTSVSSNGDGDSKFWQPWMMIGALVICVLALLFVIALVWRMRLNTKADGFHAEQSTPSVAMLGGRKSQNRQKKTLDERHSVPHIHPNYAPSSLHSDEEVCGAGTYEPASLIKSSRRTATVLEPLQPPSVRKVSRRAALSEDQTENSHRSRQPDQNEKISRRKRDDNIERRRERKDRSERPRSDRGRERSARKRDLEIQSERHQKPSNFVFEN
ncbi:serine protease family [Plasmopara halstedii]|uniref:subtilisin n=1 Tax=Plasmopara halstedii TaxID=4781 RepID=A0A0P1AUF7_PLAHL|nr:serine protease family [Plasmopara halstedii]CEG45248.1 serine protease family [Plasmopara halstedii]|eukprot:XP_024581617.1 serine protease family [Plasmopara halstedii]